MYVTAEYLASGTMKPSFFPSEGRERKANKQGFKVLIRSVSIGEIKVRYGTVTIFYIEKTICVLIGSIRNSQKYSKNPWLGVWFDSLLSMSSMTPHSTGVLACYYWNNRDSGVQVVRVTFTMPQPKRIPRI